MNERKTPKYSIEIGSPPNYNELVAYIVIDGHEVILINQDNGPNNLIIEILENKSIKQINMYEFQEAIKLAVDLLIKN